MKKSVLERQANEICNKKDFEYVKYIGSGAFKETFLVIFNGSKRALKVYYPEKFNQERSDREIKSILRCDHPNIGKIFEYGNFELEEIITHYSVDEFINGGTLTNRMISLSIKESINVGLCISDAIQHMKDLDLVHRDLKPDNIMFREDTPIVVDFGLVRDLTSTSLTPSFVPSGPGTPLYSAPEQLNNEKTLIDWRTDQFSLGIILSLLITKIHPFKNPDESNFAAINRVQNREGLADHFISHCKKNSCEGLFKLLSPWPIRRANSIEELKTVIKSLTHE